MEEKVVLQSSKAAGQSSSLLSRIKPHLELAAALLSGVFILIGWFLSKQGETLPANLLFSLAFVIGGFAKAKEGIEETIKNKDLNVELLMVIAAIGSAVIGYWAEGAVLIFIFAVSGALESYTMNKSQKEISSLMEIQPENALRVVNGKEERIHVSQLEIGDLLIVKPGERIPSDGVIVKGTTMVDEAAITGESLPITKQADSEVFAGTVNINGLITLKVTKPNSETLFQKIIALVQSAQSEKSPSQLFIEKFEGTYVKTVLSVVLLMMFIPHFTFGWSWMSTFYRAMILLVVASPCALVASIMPAALSAISNGARHGILFKGGIHLENLGNIKAVAFDKTGTLTRGKPEVTDFLASEGYDKQELLQIVASIEHQSNHPLAAAIVRFARETGGDLSLLVPDHIEDIPGWGIKAVIHNEEWFIGKADFVGKDSAASFMRESIQKMEDQGKTIVYARSSNDIACVLALQDIVRDETKAAVRALKNMGIHTIMLTGDSQKTAQAIAEKSQVDEYIAECLPETKVQEIKRIMKRFGSAAMVGDGINDAPALAAANVGIAMGEGTDVALETADVVLMKNDLPRIAEAILLSKRMNRIVKMNIFFSIAVILALIASNFFQVLNLPYGVIGHEGSTILVILNSLRLLRSPSIKG